MATMPSDVGDITTFYLEDYMANTWADAVRDLKYVNPELWDVAKQFFA